MTKADNLKEFLNTRTKGQKLYLLLGFFSLALFFYDVYILSESNYFSGFVALFFLSILTFFQKPVPNTIGREAYTPDPFNYFQALDTELKFIKHKLPLENVTRISINNFKDYGHVSLPYNHIDGKVPNFYFDKGFISSMHRYIKTYLPHVEIIE
ncbi:glycosyltransferase [Glaciecola sp. KUL10]|nr:glycosyltransferase [Glaciecola sp. KUL10]